MDRDNKVVIAGGRWLGGSKGGMNGDERLDEGW